MNLLPQNPDWIGVLLILAIGVIVYRCIKKVPKEGQFVDGDPTKGTYAAAHPAYEWIIWIGYGLMFAVVVSSLFAEWRKQEREDRERGRHRNAESRSYSQSPFATPRDTEIHGYGPPPSGNRAASSMDAAGYYCRQYPTDPICRQVSR